MCIKDIIGLIKDPKIVIEIVENGSKASFGFYDKNYVPTDFLVKEIVAINMQYVNGKRLLILEF